MPGAPGSLRRPPSGRRDGSRPAVVAGLSNGVPVDLRPEIRVDLELPLDQVDLELIHWLEYMGPHGIGNPRPVFVARNVFLEGARAVKEKHLKVVLRDRASTLGAIGFGVADRHPPETLRGGRYDVVLKLERNEWKGIARPQARLLDLRPSNGGGDAP